MSNLSGPNRLARWRPGGPGPVLGLGVLLLHLGLLAGLLMAGPVRLPTPSGQRLVMLSLLVPTAPQAAVEDRRALAHPARGARPTPPLPPSPPAARDNARLPPGLTEVAAGGEVGLTAVSRPLAGDGAASASPAAAESADSALRDAPPRPWPGNPLPAYPVAAREDGIEGRVSLRLEVDDGGLVRSLSWVARSGSALLDRAARDALQAWRFEPARRDGRAVAGSLVVRLQFRLRDGASWLALAQTGSEQ